MPGLVALQRQDDGWVVVCRLPGCGFVSSVLSEEAADDVAYDHVVAAHPEVEEP